MKKIEFVAALAEDAAKELGRIEENSGGGRDSLFFASETETQG